MKTTIHTIFTRKESHISYSTVRYSNRLQNKETPYKPEESTHTQHSLTVPLKKNPKIPI